jgi:hypothetical protein
MGLLTRCMREYLNLDLLPIRMALFVLAWVLNTTLWSSATTAAAAAADKGSATLEGLEERAGLLAATAGCAMSSAYACASLAALTTASAASKWRVR